MLKPERNSMSLYKIPKEMEYINHLIDLSDGEVTPEIEEAIKIVKEEIFAKVDSYYEWWKSTKMSKEMDKDEAAFFSKRKKTKEKLENKIKKMFLDAMLAAGFDKVTGRKITAIARKASRPSIKWDSDKPIPKKYLRVITETDNDLIYKDYKEGNLPKGFVITFSDWLDFR